MKSGIKLSPTENKNNNKTSKETKAQNIGFGGGLLVLGDLSAFPQARKHAQRILLTYRNGKNEKCLRQTRGFEHLVPS